MWTICMCLNRYLMCKNMYYLDVNFYRYYIGRQDQSVNETVMISRIDQQIRVTKLMIDYLVAEKNRSWSRTDACISTCVTIWKLL